MTPLKPLVKLNKSLRNVTHKALNFILQVVHECSFCYRFGGSYISAHVLLNLLNELGTRDKMRGLSSILSLFRNELNQINNTGARMIDSIYHMHKYTLKSHF